MTDDGGHIFVQGTALSALYTSVQLILNEETETQWESIILDSNSSNLFPESDIRIKCLLYDNFFLKKWGSWWKDYLLKKRFIEAAWNSDECSLHDS